MTPVCQESQDGCLPFFESSCVFRIQPIHIIFHARFEGKSRLITERAPNLIQIRLREVLIMRVWIIDVIGHEFCAEAFV